MLISDFIQVSILERLVIRRNFTFKDLGKEGSVCNFSWKFFLDHFSSHCLEQTGSNPSFVVSALFVHSAV